MGKLGTREGGESSGRGAKFESEIDPDTVTLRDASEDKNGPEENPGRVERSTTMEMRSHSNLRLIPIPLVTELLKPSVRTL